jgi:hypothetical protein
MSSAQSFQTSVIAELAALRAENAEMKVLLKTLVAAPPAAPAKKSKTPKVADPDAEPKEKKAPSEWILFSSKRVGALIRGLQEGMDKADKSKVGTITQFAGSLWAQKKEWSDAEITAAWPEFTPPAVSKQTAEGKSKRSGSSTGSAAAAEPVADAPEAGEKKARKPQSEETKAAAAVKRAATKAAKAAAPEAAAPATAAAAAPAAAEAAPKPKTKIAAKAKKVDLALDSWEHDGVEYLKNERGDVVTTDGEFHGHWNGTTIDTSATEPADFETLTTRE